MEPLSSHHSRATWPSSDKWPILEAFRTGWIMMLSWEYGSHSAWVMEYLQVWPWNELLEGRALRWLKPILLLSLDNSVGTGPVVQVWVYVITFSLWPHSKYLTFMRNKPSKIQLVGISDISFLIFLSVYRYQDSSAESNTATIIPFLNWDSMSLQMEALFGDGLEYVWVIL